MTLTIPALRANILRGETSYQAVLESVLSRAASLPAAHVFTRLYPEAAMASARHADAALAADVSLPALSGLPVSIKDLYDVAGEATMAGSLICADDAPAARDAASVAKLRAQGAAIVGKTNMTEFAFSGVGINPHYGTPRNPADQLIARIPGGSSSGAAVSVALGLSVAALGSDTGGSIRIPAALCGIAGFKSTQSRVSRSGAFELSRTLDTVCAMTNSVADCLTVDAALSGTALQVKARPLKGMRLAVPQTMMLDELDAVTAAAFDRALRRLSAAGADIATIEFKELSEIAALNAPGGFSAVEAYARHREHLKRQASRFDPRVARRIANGAAVGAADYIAMHDARADWIRRSEAVLSSFDALVCPTVPIVAPSIDSLIRSDDEFFKANGLLLRNTFAINYLDGCAFSIPCHAAGELPVGLMLSSTRGDDARLAAVALAAEAALEDGDSR